MQLRLKCFIAAFVVLASLLVFHSHAAEEKSSQSPSTTGNEKAILDVAHSMMEAYKKKDIATITATLTDDFLGTYDGDVWDKKTLLESLEKGEDVVESLTNSDVKVRFFGSTAIMTGQVAAKEIYKGKDISGKHRFTIVFVQLNGKWRVASEHWSSIPEEEKE